MQGQQVSREAALAELRALLADGLAKARLNKTQLAARAGLGRTTVQSAFRTADLFHRRRASSCWPGH